MQIILVITRLNCRPIINEVSSSVAETLGKNDNKSRSTVDDNISMQCDWFITKASYETLTV